MGATHPVLHRYLLGCLGLLVASLLGLAAVHRGGVAQETSRQPELSSQESEPTFRIRTERNLVVVRVVVRDAKGHAVSDLRKQDFRLFDNRKPQEISQFAVEILSPGRAPAKPTEPGLAGSGAPLAPSAPVLAPARFLALYFDDIHMPFEDISLTRKAAEHYLASAIRPSDRVGLFTSSGQGDVDFTNDRARLDQALNRLMPRPINERSDNECPQILDYQAYLIVHQHDPFATDAAAQEAYHCYCESLPQVPPNCQQQAAQMAQSEAYRVEAAFEHETEYSLRGLRELVRRMGRLPGERSVVLVSPGFLTATQDIEVDEITDQALRSNIVISTLDSRGLYAVIPLGDASKRPLVLPNHPEVAGRKAQIQLNELSESANVMRNLAYDTGGTFFHNNNDLDLGFREVGALPEAYYILAFTPENLKLDGHFHTLKVNLVNPAKLSVEARRGYFAPTKAVDAATEANEELEQAVFSQDEMSEIPIDVRTQFFKAHGAAAKLSVLTHVDLRFVRFRKENGRNLDKVTVVTVLFNGAGAYITGNEKQIQFRLLDATLDKLSRSGINTKSSFDVKPGTYLVRSVVLDSGGAQMSAANHSVEIP